jgi:nucleoside-diphosphate-sugar epimerase
VKILVTGAEGYIGSLLAPRLVEAGHEVIGLDTGYYREGCFYHPAAPRLPLRLNKDLRRVSAADLEGCEAIVHLAELSNDPLGENSPEVTYDINHKGSVRLAELARSAGISRFVYTSSCSVYGAGEGLLDEASSTAPQTAYAECKLLVERDLKQLASKGFCPVILRNATAYGASPSMRFDVVLNNLSGWAWTTKRIAMTSDGTPWRPLVHVLDICRAIECALDAPNETVHAETFNVGHNADNYRVRDIAEIVGAAFPGCEVTMGELGGDKRSYRVSFDKIHRQLPNYSCQWTAQRGAEQLRELFERIGMDESVFNARPFTRLKALRHLIATQQLDEHFFWTQS